MERRVRVGLIRTLVERTTPGAVRLQIGGHPADASGQEIDRLGGVVIALADAFKNRDRGNRVLNVQPGQLLASAEAERYSVGYDECTSKLSVRMFSLVRGWASPAKVQLAPAVTGRM